MLSTRKTQGWSADHAKIYSLRSAKALPSAKNARLVGRVLSQAERYGDYPSHRVVDHSGRLVPGWDAQAALLAREGVTLRDAQHVDLRRYQWQCE